MKNDIQFEINNRIFNYRVAIVIKNNNKILIQRDNRVTHYTLPGGRCELGESSIETAIREIKEETGFNTKFIRSIGMIENFFVSSFNGKQYHEILIIHELEFIDDNVYTNTTLHNIEEKKKKFLTYEWVSLNKLEKSNFKPEIILNIFEKKEFQHFINKD